MGKNSNFQGISQLSCQGRSTRQNKEAEAENPTRWLTGLARWSTKLFIVHCLWVLFTSLKGLHFSPFLRFEHFAIWSNFQISQSFVYRNLSSLPQISDTLTFTSIQIKIHNKIPYLCLESSPWAWFSCLSLGFNSVFYNHQN